jgi:hypothetical protein
MDTEPNVLEEIGQIYLADLETQPLAELDRMLRLVASAEETARNYRQLLHSVMHHRFHDRAQSLRTDAGKATGTVRFEQDGFTVIADLPKRLEYDQRKLREAVQSLQKWGEDPENYVSLEIKVSEAKYSAWPPAVRQLFEPARTLKTGKPTYKLERIDTAHLPAAANDSTYREVL